jgi:hypothetical protein
MPVSALLRQGLFTLGALGYIDFDMAMDGDGNMDSSSQDSNGLYHFVLLTMLIWFPAAAVAVTVALVHKQVSREPHPICCQNYERLFHSHL